MKKLIIACSIAVLSVTATFAQTKETKINSTQVTASQDGPKIEFKEEIIDYGKIENGADGYREFTFTNTGSEPLIITNAKGSCGCTVPTAPLNKPIAPGKSEVVKVHYDTKRPGKFSKSVTLTSNAVNAPTKVIRIKGEVGPRPTPTTTQAKK